MSTDVFRHDPDDADNPSRNAAGIVPHDTNALSLLPKALYFNASGWVVLRCVDATTDEAFYVSAGQTLDVRAEYIRATGTSLAMAPGAPVGAHLIVGL